MQIKKGQVVKLEVSYGLTKAFPSPTIKALKNFNLEIELIKFQSFRKDLYSDDTILDVSLRQKSSGELFVHYLISMEKVEIPKSDLVVGIVFNNVGHGVTSAITKIYP